MQLAITTNSWHYKYYKCLKNLWGWKTPEYTTLCAYSQIIVWLSVLTLICSSFLSIGWFLLKIHRFLYKMMAKTKYTTKVINLLDKYVAWGSFLESQTDKMETSPAFNCISLTLMHIFVVLSSATILGVVGFGTWKFIFLIPKIPSVLWMIVLYSGFSLFVIFSLIGYVLTHIGIGSACLIAILIHVLPVLLIWIFKIFCFLLLVVGIATPVTYLVLLISRSQRVKDWLIFRYNGFASARKNRVELIEQLKEEAKQRKVKVRYKISQPIVKSFLKRIGAAIAKFFESKNKVTANIRGKERLVKVMSGFLLIWNILKAAKDGVCPFIEFVEPENITVSKIKEDDNRNIN